jgi:hypothetical protein
MTRSENCGNIGISPIRAFAIGEIPVSRIVSKFAKTRLSYLCNSFEAALYRLMAASAMKWCDAPVESVAI